MPDQPFIVDADLGWKGVNDRVHPSQLPEGYAASAKNVKFDFGEAWARWATTSPVWGHSSNMGGNLLAMSRWWDPVNQTESLVVVTDGLRGAESKDNDGGRGRAWRVLSGGSPVEIPMNGHDIWGPARLVPTRSGLVLLRGSERRRWYIPGDLIDIGADTFEFNIEHGLVDGDVVIARYDTERTNLPAPLLPDTRYVVDQQDSVTIKLLANGGGPIVLSGTDKGLIYFELDSGNKGPGGNGAAPLILEGAYSTASGYTLPWDLGFVAVPDVRTASVEASGTEWACGTHRFDNGQGVVLSSTWAEDGGSISAGTTVYVRVINDHLFALHATAEDALTDTDVLTDDGSGLLDAAAGGVAIRPNGYSGQPIVPLREAVYYKNRLIGINQAANVAISDPGDVLHFTPFTSALTAALGNGDPLTALCPMGQDSLVLASETQVLAITGLSVPDQAVWQLQQITSEYGCIAPRSMVQVGKDVWFLSRAGVISLRQTDYGINQGVAVPMSMDIQRKVDEIDWRNASTACAAWYGNKFICAVPLKGQSGTPKNNCLLVYNFLTKSWDHFWEGTNLSPIQFSRLTIGRDEKLCWIDNDGSVKFFDQIGWEDIELTFDDPGYTYVSVPIEMSLTTRAYSGKNPRTKQWQELDLVIDTINASYGVEAITEGFNEATAYRAAVTKDPSKFLTWNTSDFSPLEADRALLPYREDYSMFVNNEVVPPFPPSYSFGGSYTPLPDFGAFTTFGGSIDAGLTVGATYKFTAGAEEVGYPLWAGYLGEPPGGGQVVLVDPSTQLVASLTLGQEVLFTATSTLRWLRTKASFGLGDPPAPVTATVVVDDGRILLPEEGAPADAHQAYQERIQVQHNCRSIQYRITNTQGSARVRSASTAGKLDRDW